MATKPRGEGAKSFSGRATKKRTFFCGFPNAADSLPEIVCLLSISLNKIGLYSLSMIRPICLTMLHWVKECSHWVKLAFLFSNQNLPLVKFNPPAVLLHHRSRWINPAGTHPGGWVPTGLKVE